MQCKYCGKNLPPGISAKRAYCNDAHKQAYYRDNQRDLQEQMIAQVAELEQLRMQVKDQAEQILQLGHVIDKLKFQLNLEYRCLIDTQSRWLMRFLKDQPPRPLIQKLLNEHLLPDHAGRITYEAYLRSLKYSPEELEEFKDLWKVLLLLSEQS